MLGSPWGEPIGAAELRYEQHPLKRVSQRTQTPEVIMNKTKFWRILRYETGQLPRLFQRPKSRSKPASQLGVPGMLLQQTERNSKDKLQGPIGTTDKLFYRNTFWNSIVCEVKLAATEAMTVVFQPTAGIKIPGVKDRHPIAVLKTVCTYENHASRIGEDLVKIKENQCLVHPWL